MADVETLGSRRQAGARTAMSAESVAGQGQPPRQILKDLAARPVDPTIADTAAAPVRRVGVCQKRPQAGAARYVYRANYSITSSARDRKDSGIVRPSAFAVLRLTTRWILVGNSIASSPGVAPLRILST